VAQPIPTAAPVITATLPVSLFIVASCAGCDDCRPTGGGLPCAGSTPLEAVADAR
jgi:hypothetical protein